MLDYLDDIIKSKEFYEEMSRFIPMDVLERTLKKEKFLDFLSNETRVLLEGVRKIILHENTEDEFNI